MIKNVFAKICFRSQKRITRKNLCTSATDHCSFQVSNFLKWYDTLQVKSNTEVYSSFRVARLNFEKKNIFTLNNSQNSHLKISLIWAKKILQNIYVLLTLKIIILRNLRYKIVSFLICQIGQKLYKNYEKVSKTIKSELWFCVNKLIKNVATKHSLHIYNIFFRFTTGKFFFQPHRHCSPHFQFAFQLSNVSNLSKKYFNKPEIT